MAEPVTIQQPPPYKPIHIFDREEEVWACAVYDHGPFCRLCQRVDDTTMACLEAVAQGHMLAQAEADGALVFKITQLGEAYVEDQISTNPEMTQFWIDIQRNLGNEGP